MKAQGSLEYLLILAAILAIAVVVVVVANSMLAPGQEAGAINQDKYQCSLQGIELVNYNKLPTTLSEAKQVKIKYQGIGGPTGVSCVDGAVSSTDMEASCNFGKEDEFVVYVKKETMDTINCTIMEA
ncbi:MAG: class III signal peptide-containing protein [Candidatus Diapherotrites archaeon]|nr:class III signal peptide-containing protein [Candidatus Diapherotrites archaeon]